MADINAIMQNPAHARTGRKQVTSKRNDYTHKSRCMVKPTSCLALSGSAAAAEGVSSMPKFSSVRSHPREYEMNTPRRHSLVVTFGPAACSVPPSQSSTEPFFISADTVSSGVASRSSSHWWLPGTILCAAKQPASQLGTTASESARDGKISARPCALRTASRRSAP